MATLSYLFAWANAPYAVAGGVAILFALLSASGLLGLLAGSGDGDHDADVDAEHGIDHDVDAGHDVDHDVDAGHVPPEHDADGEADDDGARDAVHGGGHHVGAEPGFGALILRPLGFGKVPFSIIWQSYAIVFAVAGLAVNTRFVGSDGALPLTALAVSVPAASTIAYGAVALLARVLGPMLASRREDATNRNELVGQVGVVISSRVSPTFGEVRVRDKTGLDLRVVCRLAPGMREPREKEEVVIVRLDEGGALLVSPLEHPEGTRNAEEQEDEGDGGAGSAREEKRS